MQHDKLNVTNQTPPHTNTRSLIGQDGMSPEKSSKKKADPDVTCWEMIIEWKFTEWLRPGYCYCIHTIFLFTKYDSTLGKSLRNFLIVRKKRVNSCCLAPQAVSLPPAVYGHILDLTYDKCLSCNSCIQMEIQEEIQEPNMPTLARV